MTPLEMFYAWNDAVKKLEDLKKRELELRTQLVEHYFPDAPEGTHTLDMSGGWSLKCQARVNRTVENRRGEADQVAAMLPPEVKDKVFAWQPKLQLRGYRKLAPEHRALVDSVVTSKPGTPSLTLVPPKE